MSEDTLEISVQNRAWLVSRVRAEVVGPDPVGEAVVPVDAERLPACTWPEFRTPRKQVNGEEILWQDPPLNRYGAGILYPVDRQLIETGSQEAGSDDDMPISDDSPENDEVVSKVDEATMSRAIPEADDTEDYDVSLVNAMSPSAIGLSFLADVSAEKEGFSLQLVNVSRISSDKCTDSPSGTYQRAKVMVKNDSGREIEKTVWLRRPMLDTEEQLPHVEISSSEILEKKVIRKPANGTDGVEAVVVSRPWSQGEAGNDQVRLLTVTLVNRRAIPGLVDDEQAVFQAGLRVNGRSGQKWILPYPEEAHERAMSPHDPLSDEAINQVLYRERRTFAIGHGCAADWASPEDNMVNCIWTEALPSVETPATTADLEIKQDDGSSSKLKVSMRKLAGLDPTDTGLAEVDSLVFEYEKWIQHLESDEVNRIQDSSRETGEALINRCRNCLERIKAGISLLGSDGEVGELARKAFRLANHAMLLAQLRGGKEKRIADITEGNISWSRPAEAPGPSESHPYKGYWRPFQIAFLLMSLKGICDPGHEDRDVVDLIWFPTGGGKTEAYLGVTAFTIFFNRLAGKESKGCDVLMRYTLRLLTAQQFQRAATLFCAMEHLRKKDKTRLGVEPFTLGLWVGGGTTPNKRADAVAKLKKLKDNPTEENPFVLLQCPWCAAQMGPTEDSSAPRRYRGSGRTANSKQSVLGYVAIGKGSDRTVVYQCPDEACEFSSGSALTRGSDPLPISTIDEDLIAKPPRLLIGTVDKFAMLAWKPELRRFFGLDDDGQHYSPPPSLIIQDELHLISGPLGTMVGAYETIIDKLCRSNGVNDIGPKIIASTATISRAREQVQHLYARRSSAIFPPSGLRASDSFFAKEAAGPGRMYLGVMAPGYYSIQTTQARIFATLLQSVANMPTGDAGKDPWWTLLCFFNSLRELGGAATLMVADVREYIRVLMDRHGWDYKKMRNTMATELTSRIRGDEIPKELAKLEISLLAQDEAKKRFPVNVCLASSIIEVGVDLPRLSLMAIVGQPKSTSQYIQVSSRVGRGNDKPGLVLVLYGQSKPRDRSHYERFRGYHQKLYAQVEPTSVTPFSAPATERALQGLILSVVRQLGEIEVEARSPRPYPYDLPNGLLQLLKDMIRERAEIVTNGEETEAVMRLLDRRLSQWREWDPAAYGGFGSFPESPPLMFQAGANPPKEWNNRSWPVLSSLRNVDASTEAEITDWFNSTVEGGNP